MFPEAHVLTGSNSYEEVVARRGWVLVELKLSDWESDREEDIGPLASIPFRWGNLCPSM